MRETALQRPGFSAIHCVHPPSSTGVAERQAQLPGPRAETSTLENQNRSPGRLQRQIVSKRNVLVDYSTAHYHDKLLCSFGVLGSVPITGESYTGRLP
jgi:hypothetical protein